MLLSKKLDDDKMTPMTLMMTKIMMMGLLFSHSVVSSGLTVAHGHICFFRENVLKVFRRRVDVKRNIQDVDNILSKKSKPSSSHVKRSTAGCGIVRTLTMCNLRNPK